MITTERTFKNLVFLDENNKCVSWMTSVTVGVFSLGHIDHPSSIDTINPIVDDYLIYRYHYDSSENQYYHEISINENVYQSFEYTGPSEIIEGSTYDSDKNIFIPVCPVEGWIFDEETLEWHPDPSITYDLHGDGKHYRYDMENNVWHPTW
jgi:hypothetical protein